jgi:c-di-AMP phosphodiesterase-like protein
LEALGGGGNSSTAGGRVENGDISVVRQRLTEAIDAYFEK